MEVRALEIVKNIAAIIGLVLSALALISACTTGGRKAIKMVFTHNTKEIVQHDSAQDAQINELSEEVRQVSDKLDSLGTRLAAVEKLCENLDFFDGVVEVSRQQCRNTIKKIYYKYYKTGHIPMYERKTADSTFRIYNNILKGNSYASLLYDQICKLQIDPSDIKEDE